MENQQGRFKFWDFNKRVHVYSDNILQMSATDIMMAKECEWKLVWKYTQPKITTKSVYLMIGSCFHEVIEQDLRFFVKRGIHYGWNDIEKMFNAIWGREKQNTDFSRLAENKAHLKCENYIRIYFQKALPMIYPLGQEFIEKFFCVHITYGERKLGITGKVDVIDRSMWIIDHKTSSSDWTQEEAEKEAQAIIYPYCMKNEGYNILGFKFNVCHAVVVTPFSIVYNQAKVKEWLTFAFDVKQRIEEGTQLRSKSERVCKYCDWNKICSESLFKVNENA